MFFNLAKYFEEKKLFLFSKCFFLLLQSDFIKFVNSYESYLKYGVDHFISDRISVHRSVGERRHPICLEQESLKFKFLGYHNCKTYFICVFQLWWLLIFGRRLKQPKPHYCIFTRPMLLKTGNSSRERKSHILNLIRYSVISSEPLWTTT